MTTMTFKSTELKLDGPLETEIHSLGKDWIIFESQPDQKISLEAKHLKDLNLKPGDKIKLEPITNSFTLTTLDPRPVEKTTTRKSGSSPVLSDRHRDDSLMLGGLIG